MQKGCIHNKQGDIVFSRDDFIPFDDRFADIGGAKQKVRWRQTADRPSLGDVGTEIRAGVVTFMTMCYILVVNPTILAEAGLPLDGVLFATAVSSAACEPAEKSVGTRMVRMDSSTGISDRISLKKGRKGLSSNAEPPESLRDHRLA